MLNSLDLLVIVSMVMAAASLLSLSLMFLARRPVVRKAALYVAAALGLYSAYGGVYIGLGLDPVQVAVGVAAGIAGIAAVVLERMSKGSEKKLRFACVMASASVIVGIINAFM